MAGYTEETTRPLSVLVVDDHVLFAEAMQLALRPDPGIGPVDVVTSVAQAVAHLEKHRVDVVLLDYRLPDISGVEGIRAVLHAAPSTPVVLVTAVDDEAVLLAAIEAGCAGFVLKSATLQEMRAAVHAAAQGEALISPRVLRRLLDRLDLSHHRRGEDLSDREREVLALVVEGLTNADIAARLFLSVHTVRNHVQSVLSKLGAHSKLEAAAIATREGLL